MAEQQKKMTVSDLPQMLAEEKVRIAKAKKEALLLLKAPHNIEQAKKGEEWFRDCEFDLLIVREFIDNNSTALSAKDVEKYGKDCDELSKTAIDFGNRFTQSIKTLEQEKKDRRINFATLLTITVAAPALLYNTIKARGEEFATAATVAQGTLMTFGLGFYFRDDIKKIWKEAAKGLTPREIGDSANFMLYYMKKTVAESDLSPLNIIGSVGILAYSAKEAAALKFKEANDEWTRRTHKIKPVRKILERKIGRRKRNGLS